MASSHGQGQTSTITRAITVVRQRVIDLIQAPYYRGMQIYSTFSSKFRYFDWSRVDYRFWDQARRGRARGLEVSGLFLQPLNSKVASWVLGRAPAWILEDSVAQEALNTWQQQFHTDILRAYEESGSLGDCYVVINPDLTVTVVSPHFVEEIVDEDDLSNIIGWKITTEHSVAGKPHQRQTTVDEFTLEQRVRTITINGSVVSREVYPNLIGRLPIIHWPNLLGADEKFGRPNGEALVPLLHRYGEVLDAAIQGNIRQGRPTPVIEKMGDAKALELFWEKFGTWEEVEQPDGSIRRVPMIDFDADKMLTLGNDATFKWASPGAFAKETAILLELLFYLMVQFSEVPEFIWGTAISSSKASAEAQLEPFVRWIEKRRGIAEKVLVEIGLVVLAYMNVLARVDDQGDTRPQVRWRRMMTEDGRLTFDTLSWAYESGLVDGELFLKLAPIDVPDPELTFQKAQQEKDDRDEKEANRQGTQATPGARTRRPSGRNEEPDSNNQPDADNDDE